MWLIRATGSLRSPEGTGAYVGATGQARYVDSETQTDIYIDFG